MGRVMAWFQQQTRVAEAETLDWRWVVGSLVVLVAATYFTTNLIFSRSWLAERIESSVADVPDDAVSGKLQELALLDAEAIPSLTRLLGDRRNSVVLEARNQIDELLLKWRDESVAIASPKIQLLAEQLAENISEYSASSQMYAARLSTELLLWPVDRKVIDSGELVVSCEKIWRVSSATRTSNRRAEVQVSAVESIARPNSLSSSDAGYIATDIVVADLPGGTLAISPEEIPSRIDPPVSQSIQPRLLIRPTPRSGAGAQDNESENDSNSTSVPGFPTENTPLQGEMNSEESNERSLNEASSDAVTLGPPRELPSGKPIVDQNVMSGPVVADSAAFDFTSLSHIQLFGRLSHSDQTLVAAMLTELERRGFSAAQIEIGRLVASQNVDDRMKAISELARGNGVDPIPFLQYLQKDANREVRIAALRMLAVSDSPDVAYKAQERLAREVGPTASSQLR